jgi:hypothetical protein
MLLWRHRHLLLILTLVAMASFGATSQSAAQTNDPITLAANPIVQQDRIQLIRQEFRERRQELRELAERMKHHGARGRKAEPALPDVDYVGPLTGALKSPFNTQVAPANVLVNNKSGDAAGAGQAEQRSVFLGLNGICAWNNGQGFNVGPDVQAYGWSTDGGATWNANFVPLKQGTITVWTSDPVVTVNEKTSDFYYCGLTSNGSTANGVGVMRGHFGGGTFITDASTVVASGPNASQVYDKEWMCADSSNGNLYVTWTLFTTTGDGIFFSRSTDNGASWSAPLQISGSWENGLVSGSRPLVGPNGEVYVIYAAIGPVDADSMKIAKSVDGGLTFGPSVAAMTEYDDYFSGAPGFNRPRAVTFPAAAVDRTSGPNRGRVYMTVQDCVNFYGDPIGGGTSQSEVEPNGFFVNATPFAINQTLRGTVSSTTDSDWFKFNANQGTTYIFFVDSLRTSAFRYQMRLYCPNDTTVLSRLASSGNQATNDATNQHALIVWTAPTTNTYYLRMLPVSGSGGYRIRTGLHTPVISDVSRDTRDVMVAASPNGVTGWTPRHRINDDLGLYDDWLPEITVPCDGNAYAMWYDWRDTPASCFGGSNIYVSRSTDGGATWSPNQVATTVVTANWTQVASNIAPNQGDYNGMYGVDAVDLSWADGRLGDADVFAARVPAGFTLFNCPPSQVALANNTFVGGASLTNQNGMFGNGYSWTLTANVAWPGLPLTGTASAGAGASTVLPFGFFVPDTAANGEVVHCCLTVNCAQGDCGQSCCFDLTVSNAATGTLASLASASADAGSVRLSWLLSAATSATVERSSDGLAWSAIGQVTPDGSRMVSFVDRAVQGGARYAYRLTFSYGGTVAHDGQTWVTVPNGAEFALKGAAPNPASHGFEVSFSLPNGNRATLEVIDLSGRRLVQREVGGLGAGFHTVSLQRETAGLPAGMYGLRLAQGARVLTAKVSVVR